MKKTDKIIFPKVIEEILSECPEYVLANNVEELVELSCAGASDNGWHDVDYEIPGEGRYTEARVCKVKNGVAANYTEAYMRRRDPDSLLVADDFPTDKEKFDERFGYDFEELRDETVEWLKSQKLCVFLFKAGPKNLGNDAIALAPANAGFFALGLGLLQGVVDTSKLEKEFKAGAAIFVAPPFRHTHFDGKQVVVHRRKNDFHEMFSYNLYPGPSAKKGVYGMLINQGEFEEWVTLHCSTVQVITPYDNKINISHEGASGSGKSEMLEDMHRERSGRLLLGRNTVTGEERYITLPQGCNLRPVTDDMAVTNPEIQKNRGKLTLQDAENSWFMRVNHIERYGTDPHLEEISCMNREPMLFLNLDVAPGSTALIWEHIHDEPGKPCPNPRLVLPRKAVEEAIDEPVEVDIRSFGVRTPVCTKENPTYGIFGLFHVLPPALAWLWRLVSPRGASNPSIIVSEGMSSEGVGSYWPFATGKKIKQANLLLKQIIEFPKVRYILTPNQYIGAWKVGFMPQWIAREYLARRGGAWFTEKQITPARAPLLGYAIQKLMIEGNMLEKEFLRVENQPEVGYEAYDKGYEMLSGFFKTQIKKFLEPGLLPEGKKIIECCLSDGTLEDYCSIIDSESIIIE